MKENLLLMKGLKEEEWHSTTDIFVHSIHWSEKIQKVAVAKKTNTP